MFDEKRAGQMLSVEQARSKMVERLANLSLEALNELAVFVEFLHLREQVVDQPNKEIVKLKGLWKGAPFDVTDEDIQQIRREFTQQLQKRLEKV